ncbi:hypothetical protein L873DRAFT_1464684 [Choiromyces venosus 120613-1]|uniref:Uncharacterized protein n=1 Tax=Choiromyces venosus 120613-1 TaxID=1336337 RepID=A0A3N4K110_9PEZI|nr:hypothetical protein L873DRAFT_1464684 [Choiromyces venosus 120613-1]
MLIIFTKPLQLSSQLLGEAQSYSLPPSSDSFSPSEIWWVRVTVTFIHTIAQHAHTPENTRTPYFTTKSSNRQNTTLGDLSKNIAHSKMVVKKISGRIESILENRRKEPSGTISSAPDFTLAVEMAEVVEYMVMDLRPIHDGLAESAVVARALEEQQLNKRQIVFG